MKLESIHKSNILSEIQKVMMEDIKSSIMIVNERLGAPCRPEPDFSTGDIFLCSYVNGYEGCYEFIRVTILLTKNKDYYYPVLQIAHIFNDGGENINDIPLRTVRIDEVMRLRKAHLFTYSKRIKEYIIKETQSERITILDEVTELFDKELQHYRVGGMYNPIHAAMRLI